MNFLKPLFDLLTARAVKRTLELGGFFVLLLSLSGFSCRTSTSPNHPQAKRAGRGSTTNYLVEVVRTWPHDRDAFTQGLLFHEGKLIESTGQQGNSSLRLVELETGRILEKVDVPRPYFAEGITLLNGRIYQLTWQHQLGFIYDGATFSKIGQFNYDGEGWGLTDDGQSLIVSDGSDRLRFINPDNFQVTRTIAVSDGGKPVIAINELEYVQGEIYANIWHDDRIARIDVKSGRVVGWIDLTALPLQVEVQDEEAVLNGIAYDNANARLFVTGKLWPKIFEIRLLPNSR
ncbi:MAG: glutaminyl-peptide cyclotransferase [Pyrinomonadaceae bacterium]